MALAAVRIPVALPETDAGKRPARRDDRATGVASPNPAFAIAASLSTGDPVRRSLREPWLGRMPAPYGQQSVRPRQTISRVQDRLDGIPVVCDGWAARVVRFSSGADLTFATHPAASSQSECQIQSSTRIQYLLVVL
jgi:hypothetical protein